MTSKQKTQIALYLGVSAPVFYFLLPIFAGIFAIGDLRGPAIYPEDIHHGLFITGWELAGREGKPRISARGNPPRPLFYGF